MVISGELIAFLERIANVFQEWPQLEGFAEELRVLAKSAPEPFRVAIIGRMKAGKSTLINSLIGERLAITDTEEATATLNVISYGEGDTTRHFVAVKKDGTAETFPIERLKSDWTGTHPEVIERIREASHLQLYASAAKLKALVIIDTPGTGSVVEEHEAAAASLLRPQIIATSVAQGERADAILYVISSSGRETDEDALSLFGEGRLSAADPYNSLGVLHKWDHLAGADPYNAACLRAERLSEHLKAKVLTVLPVSGPFALAAQLAPDHFFTFLLEVLAEHRPELDPNRKGLDHYLKHPTLWDKDARRRAARDAIHWTAEEPQDTDNFAAGRKPETLLPWSCFQRLVACFLREMPRSAAEARAECWRQSHLPELESLLEKHFFRNTLVIKRCQLLRKAQQPVERGIGFIREAAQREKVDVTRADRAAKQLAEPELVAWAQRKANDAHRDNQRLETLALQLGREWQQHHEHLEGLQRDLQILRSLLDEDGGFPEVHQTIIRSVCEHDEALTVSAAEIRPLIGYYRGELRHPIDKEFTELLEHLIRRLEGAYHARASRK